MGARQTDSAPILKDRSHVLVILDLTEMEWSVPILTNVPMRIGVTPTQNAPTRRAHSPVLVIPDSREAGQTEIAQISTSAQPTQTSATKTPCARIRLADTRVNVTLDIPETAFRSAQSARRPHAGAITRTRARALKIRRARCSNSIPR